MGSVTKLQPPNRNYRVLIDELFEAVFHGDKIRKDNASELTNQILNKLTINEHERVRNYAILEEYLELIK